jgi:two-component system response regulator FixJ
LLQDQVVAVVDDDRSVREALADLLQVEGYRTRVFADGPSLLAGPGLDEIACVVSDVRMPGMNGLELQRRLRAARPALPVIFITSSADEAMQAKAMEDGAAAWLAKPVSDAALLAYLGAALAAARHESGPGRRG